MLELLAYAPEDGWAFVKTPEGIVLQRPPYRSTTMRRQLDDSAVKHAVCHEGFTEPPQDRMQDWAGLIQFLHQRIHESRRDHGQVLPEDGLGEQILQYAPSNVIDAFLQAEQHGEPEDDAARQAEWRGRCRPRHRGIRRQPAVDQPDQEPDRGVGNERQLVRGNAIGAGHAGNVVGDDRQQCATGAEQRAHHAVAGKEVGALPVADGTAQRRLFQRQEDADVARRRIERTHEGDEHEWPEPADRSEANPCRQHQETRCEQQLPNTGVGSVEADGQRQQRRSQQRCGGQYADPQGIETKSEQIGGQQHADAAVGKRTHPARDQNELCRRRRRRWKEAHRHPMTFRTVDSNGKPRKLLGRDALGDP
jgi:hypothetical protein